MCRTEPRLVHYRGPLVIVQPGVGDAFVSRKGEIALETWQTGFCRRDFANFLWDRDSQGPGNGGIFAQFGKDPSS